jgi:hypothetical protein
LIFIYLSYGYQQGQVIERLVTEGLVQQQICKIAGQWFMNVKQINIFSAGRKWFFGFYIPQLHKLAKR